MTADEIQADYVARMGTDLGEFMYFLQNDVHWLRRKWREFSALFGPDSGNSDLLNRVAANFSTICSAYSSRMRSFTSPGALTHQRTGIKRI